MINVSYIDYDIRTKIIRTSKEYASNEGIYNLY